MGGGDEDDDRFGDATLDLQTGLPVDDGAAETTLVTEISQVTLPAGPAIRSIRPLTQRGLGPASLPTLTSPFSLVSALKFGAIFLVLQVGGTLAETWLGRGGFYGVSVIGGLVSSASSVASAGTLAASGKVAPYVAGIGAILASLASASINVGVVHRVSRSSALGRKVTVATALIVGVGVAGAVASSYLGPSLAAYFGGG